MRRHHLPGARQLTALASALMCLFLRHSEFPFLRFDAISGGAEEIRTPDPYVANVMLYQLSYRPV